MLFQNTIATIALAASTAHAAATPGFTVDQRDLVRRSLSGQATFYGGNVQGGACSFSTYTLPSGLFGTAISDSNWDTAGQCGGCVQATYQGKSVTAMIVDECPGCGSNHLDLFPDAFAKLADKSKGVIDLTWDYVPCPVSGPLSIHMKTGTSQYWFSAQVVNTHRRTAKLEASTDGGKTWKEATRTTYNFYEITSGVGASTADIRVTSHVGTTVVIKGVPMQGDAVKAGPSNYA